MITDAHRVIVVGSGPAGATAALELVRRGLPVTMLESGLTLPRGVLIRALGRTILRRYPALVDRVRHVASADPDATWIHELTPGGLSNYWTGAVPRFAPEDFTEGARLHERYRWPLNYQELAPYYERIERLLRVTGAMNSFASLPASHVSFRRCFPRDWRRLACAAQAQGQGLTPTPLADGAPWMLRSTATAFNSFTAIVQRLLSSPLFDLVLGAHALRIDCNPADRTARSVVYYDRLARCERRVDGAAVVVAAGALASTKLLLDSSSAAFPDGLGNTEGVLGKYLHDHPKDWFEIELDRPLRRLPYPAYLTRAPYDESPPLSAAACTIVTGRTIPEKILGVVGAPVRWLGAVVFGTTIPTADSYVGLDAAAKDAFGLPMLDLHIRYDEGAQEATRRARERFVQILDAAGYRSRLTYQLPRLDPPGETCHYGGSVRMHDSPHCGMLNRWNRLHAVDNVAVVDASSFTTGVEKNPTLTVMALAARAADKLALDLRTS